MRCSRRTAGRSRGCWMWSPYGTVNAGWLKAQDQAFIAGIKQASLDPFRGYAKATRDELPDDVPVLDAFHVVKLGTQVVAVRRRVQQEELGRRGHKDDPLYRIRGLLRRGREHLSERQVGRAQHVPGRRRPRLGSHPLLALLPAAALHVPGHEPG